jgi:hypothetical protein
VLFRSTARLRRKVMSRADTRRSQSLAVFVLP